MRIPTSTFKNINHTGVDWTKVLAVDAFRFEQVEERSNYADDSLKKYQEVLKVL